jgi:sulfur-oxidizing protein SoxZ
MNLIHVLIPNRIERGQIIPIQVKIQHPMYNGWAISSSAHAVEAIALPRKMLKNFHCFLNDTQVFASTFFEGMAANPYLSFKIRANSSGELRLRWEAEDGEVFEHKTKLNIM